MATLEMNGPHDFNAETINKEVSQTKAGNYALGYVDSKNVFRVKYIGRSDFDVKNRLLKHLGEHYEKFKYCYATSPKTAFEKECQNYHDFNGFNGKLLNKIHPDHPSNSKDWKCPVCDIF